MVHPIVAKVKKVRNDLSDWVWHFVKRENAFSILKSILHTRKLVGSYDNYTDTTVISFTEAPAYEFARQSALLAEHGYARLSDYGIGFRKRWIFERGGLPVIYQPAALLNKFSDLPFQYRFRHMRYDPTADLDYTWQREWRVHTPALAFAPADAVVIVPSFSEANGILYNIEEDGDHIDGEAVSFPSITPMWSFIAHDQFHNLANINDNTMELSICDDLSE